MDIATPGTVLELDHGFVVSTGIECSAPVIEGGIRQDELRKTGHWDRVEEDLALVAGMGITFLRYGIPFHVVSADPSQLDWAWTDRALAELRRQAIEPIADLLHFGLPSDLTGFGDPRLPGRYEAYVEAFARRYPWVRYYTPVNEPLISARFSAQLGWWNERRTDDRSYVAAIDGASTCAVLGMAAVRERRDDAIFLQSDTCEGFAAADPRAEVRTRFLNELRFAAWDLTYGRRPGQLVVDWFASNGLEDDRLDWFAAHGSSRGCIVGHDFYAGNEWLVDADGGVRINPEPGGYAAQARDYHDHFQLPFMLSETNAEAPRAQPWLESIWAEVTALLGAGLPIRGICWYGFIDHVDWDTALREVNGTPNECGLVSLDRHLHRVGERYRDLALAVRSGGRVSVPRLPDTTEVT